MHLLTQLHNDVRGTTSIEYGMICGGIVLVLLAALSGVADETNGLWAVVSAKTEAAHSGTAP